MSQALELSDWMRNAGASLSWHGPQAMGGTQAMGGVVPVICSEPNPPQDQCYITSPKIAWFEYAALELGHQRCLSWTLLSLGRVANALGLSHHCVIGNFPISTVVWTASEMEHMPTVCSWVEQSMPDRFLFVRNVQLDQHAELVQELKAQGFYALPARVVYHFDLRQEPKKHASQLLRDMKSTAKLGLTSRVLTHLTQEESEHVQLLYESVYIRKHGPYNAQYTPRFFSDMVNQGWMSCLVIQNEDETTRAFALLHRVGETLTVPALGYDLREPEIGLYRALFVEIFRHALHHKLLLNYSSGAGDFKRKRGGQPRLEYTLVKAPRSCWHWKSKLLQRLETWSSRLGHEDLISWGA